MCKRALILRAAVAVGLSAAAAGQSLPSSLVGWWKLDEGSGTTAQNAAGSKHHGTLVGGPVWKPGRIGGGLEFDGLDDFVRIPDDPAITFSAAQSYTLAAWVYVPQPPTGWNGIVCKGRQSGGGAMYYGIWIGDNGGTPTWYYGTWPTWGSPVAEGGWYHVVVTQDGAANAKQLYLNGELDSQTTAQAANAAGALLFGSDREPGDSFEGIVDDVQLYNRAISAAQVSDLLNGSLPDWSKAEKPEPADGALAVISPLLKWSAGDGAIFHNVYLGTSPDLTEADLVGSRVPFTMYWHIPGVEPGVTYHWRVDEIQADMTTVVTGTVWSFITQALTAYHPDPADGAVDVSPAPTLSWLPGQMALLHHVYFGDSLDAVAQGAADADKGTVEETVFTPGALENVTTYWWRVDETVADNTVKTGPVWSFTTYLPVEDFEGFTDELDNRLYETWLDGWTNGTGSTVGYMEAPFAERTIVHGGAQSMPLDYNNIDAPFYSEAERTFAPVQDWTINGAAVLTLHVRGNTANSPEKLYVTIEDSAGKTAAVVHPDPEAVRAAKWIQWKIPLAEFTGVNAARVRTLYIGVGDRDKPVAGGRGLIFVDDIYVSRP